MARPPRAVYIPLYANLVLMAQRRRGFFATLTKRRLKRGVFHSIFDLQASINRFLKEHNIQPKPFVWTADPDKIIAAVRRGHQMLNSIPLARQPGSSLRT